MADERYFCAARDGELVAVRAQSAAEAMTMLAAHGLTPNKVFDTDKLPSYTRDDVTVKATLLESPGEPSDDGELDKPKRILAQDTPFQVEDVTASSARLRAKAAAE